MGWDTVQVPGWESAWEMARCRASQEEEGLSPQGALGDGAGLLPSEVVRVPVQAVLYLQAMAENGQGDRPRALGPALPSGHVRYRQ